MFPIDMSEGNRMNGCGARRPAGSPFPPRRFRLPFDLIRPASTARPLIPLPRTKATGKSHSAAAGAQPERGSVTRSRHLANPKLKNRFDFPLLPACCGSQSRAPGQTKATGKSHSAAAGAQPERGSVTRSRHLANPKLKNRFDFPRAPGMLRLTEPRSGAD
jgi:hypothetical protein